MPVNGIFANIEGGNDITLTPQEQHLRSRINTGNLHRTLYTLFRLLWRN